MNFIRRIGYDAGATPLEDALALAAQNGFHYLDFSADTGPNQLDHWPDHRIRAVLATMERHRIAAPSVVVHSVVVHAGMRFSAAVAERMAAARDRLLRAVDYAETGSVSLFFENLNRAPDAAEVHYLGHTR